MTAIPSGGCAYVGAGSYTAATKFVHVLRAAEQYQKKIAAILCD